MDELVDRSAVELAAMLVARQVSATEVVEAHLRQIAVVNGRVNAIVTLESEGALRAAKRLDAQPRGEAVGSLHGLPIAIKDLVDVSGMRTTLGSPIYRNRVPSKDASHVSRLRDAGAIIVGKTNTSEFGAGSQTFNTVFGVTRNPWDPSRTAEDVPVELKGLRVAWSRDLGDLPIEESVLSALERNLELLEAHGCSIEAVDLQLPDADEVFHVLRALAFVRERRDDVTDHPELVKDTVIWNVEEGLALDPVRIARTQRVRSELFRSFATFLEAFDVLALPACAVLPFPAEVEWPREVNGHVCDAYLDWMRVCTRISVTAHPAISIPFAFSEEGLPVGLQLVGRYRQDEQLLRVAAAIEAVSDASSHEPVIFDRS